MAAPKETEASFQAAVIAYAKRLGWLVNHVYDSRKSGPDKGFPDLVLVRRGRVLFIELKTRRGRVRPEQENWLGALNCAGARAFVARPQDWPLIERELQDEAA